MSIEQKTNSLYSALGDVSDRYVQEAAEYGNVKRNAEKKMLIIPVVAASLAVMLIIGNVFSKINKPKNSQASETEEADPGFAASVISLSAGKETVSDSELNFYTGPAVFWSCDGGKTVYYTRITNGEFSTYLNYLESGSKTAPKDYESEIMVWVSDSEGSVSSPFLKQTNGNIAFGHLFDYSPEVIPSDSCLDYIKQLMI